MLMNSVITIFLKKKKRFDVCVVTQSDANSVWAAQGRFKLLEFRSWPAKNHASDGVLSKYSFDTILLAVFNFMVKQGRQQA